MAPGTGAGAVRSWHGSTSLRGGDGNDPAVPGRGAVGTAGAGAGGRDDGGGGPGCVVAAAGRRDRAGPRAGLGDGTGAGSDRAVVLVFSKEGRSGDVYTLSHRT